MLVRAQQPSIPIAQAILPWKDSLPPWIPHTARKFPFSNFQPSTVMYESDMYATVEHAFQASRTKSQAKRRIIQAAPSPSWARRLSREVVPYQTWHTDQLAIMDFLLAQKFRRPPYRKLLLDYPPESPIIYWNLWHDTYWGCCICTICKGQGGNRLGLNIDDLRTELVTESQD